MKEAPTPHTAPCDDVFTGRPIIDWCADCSHSLGVHRRDNVCSVCDAIAALHAELTQP